MWVQATFLGAGYPFLDSRTLAGWVFSGYRQIGDLHCKNRQIGGFYLQKQPKVATFEFTVQIQPFLDKDPCYVCHRWLSPDWLFYMSKNRQIGGFWLQKQPKWRLLNNLAIYSPNSAIFGHKDPCYVSNQQLFPYQKSPNLRNWRSPDRQIGKKKYVSKCSKLPNSSRNAIKKFSPIWRPGATGDRHISPVGHLGLKLAFRPGTIGL